MKTADIRRTFLEFFNQRGHTVVPSAPLVPANDPTLMFTNSGMVQFKNVFLGSEKPGYVRAVDVQRCLRAGGKHNDLDQVGYTARHHTFFEMLGNWSFGDYFKREAIAWSWELLTGVFGLAPERLLATVYQDDDEAYAIWRDDIGLPPERIIRIGDNMGAPYASDNFWQMAETGPCGPSSEIFYDHGADVPGGPPGSPDEDGDRFIEIWNLVFMQFDRQPDGSLEPLPAPCVDTGMGLERLAAILQGVHSNYEIDLFQRLIKAAAELTGTTDLENKSLRVIVDHIRACSFLVVDGVLPSREGRGYVLRRIIRRALRHGWMLGVRGEFFWQMVAPLVAEMGEAYPELAKTKETVETAMRKEEQRFGETLEHGMKLFDEVAAEASSDNAKPGGRRVELSGTATVGATATSAELTVIKGDDAFRLYDTYGFPVDLTADIARERGMAVDMEGFEKAMQAQRERARSASHFKSATHMPAELMTSLAATEFLGYDTLQADATRVLAIVRDGQAVEQLAQGEQGIVILDRTPFYAESGGQVGDRGTLLAAGGHFAVSDTQKLAGSFHGHVGTWQGDQPLVTGTSLAAEVDGERRQATVLNHTATHLLHAALREELGTGVIQKGSLVEPERLRFDFSHDQPVSTGQLQRIESRVNDEIRANHVGDVREMGYDQAIEFGALALFGEKYGDQVRVLKLGDFSTELCGGTHVRRTGDIGLFKIVSESGVASGIRRIEALTGAAALARIEDEEKRLADIAHTLSCSPADVRAKLAQLLDKHKAATRELESLRSKAAGSAVTDLAGSAALIAGIRLVAARLEGMHAKALREAMDQLKQQLPDSVIVLASGKDGKATLVAGVQGRALEWVKAGELVSHVARQINGKGGGRPGMAQGGGEDGPALAKALDGIESWLRQRAE